jgi:peptidoglycan/LPS O-acetylase OafA/YrhL
MIRPAAVPADRSPGTVPNMDLLRALAVSSVMAYHFLPAKFRAPGVGWAGVWLFFVLSGFLITRNLIAGIDHLSFKDWIATFYWRRMLRIFPLYFGYVFVATLLVAAISSSSTAEHELPWLITFTENLRNWRLNSTSPFFDHLWSLSTEEQFYLVFPLLIYAVPVKARNGVLVAMFLAVPAARGLCTDMLTMTGHTALQIENLSRVFPFMQWDAFVAGAILAINEDVVMQARAAAIAGVACAGLFAVGAIVALRLVFIDGVNSLKDGLLVHDVNHQAYQEIWLYTLLTIAFACLVLCASRVRLRQTPFVLALNRLGRISFGMYVFHMPICGLMLRLTHGWSKPLFCVGFAVMFALTAALAELSYRYWETPFLQLKGRLPRLPFRPFHGSSARA